MWRTVLEIALALSVGVNIYLLARHGDAPATAHAARPVATAQPCSPVTAQPAAVIDAAVPPAPACPPAARADCSAIEKQLVETEAKLEEQLPPNERYTHATRSVDIEARAHTVLDPVFATISKTPHAYDVECHGNVCKLSVVDPALDRKTWMDAVQANGGFRSWAFSSAGTFATLGTPDESARGLLMGEIGHALDRDPGLAGCARGEKPAGSLTLDIVLDPATRRLNATASGSLANEPAGSCVRTHVQGLLDTIKAPAELQSFEQRLPLLP